ncbi:hypothetical protein BHM03_00010133 [Ensete ventricosum]|nr:hypothetical protein BHM03_00010133 [Ensete ventricosum]
MRKANPIIPRGSFSYCNHNRKPTTVRQTRRQKKGELQAVPRYGRGIGEASDGITVTGVARDLPPSPFSLKGEKMDGDVPL